mmetsp:Transcript_46440/g.148978  ORF Transcript_46440/g.148978 Transcript_46440/m.148978 type:complete len:82 (-) Transcript_46440:548-793(-)
MVVRLEEEMDHSAPSLPTTWDPGMSEGANGPYPLGPVVRLNAAVRSAFPSAFENTLPAGLLHEALAVLALEAAPPAAGGDP